MGYLFCEKCGGYYELKEGESVEDFAHCSCGGNLTYTENIEGLELLQNSFKESNKSKDSKKSKTDNKSGKSDKVPLSRKSHEKDDTPDITSSDFKDEKFNKKIKRSEVSYLRNNTSQQLSYLGLILMVVGLLLLIFAFFYPFLFFESAINNPENILVLFVQTVWIYLISIVIMILGAFIFLFSNIAMRNTKKRSKVNIMDETLKGLPGSYTILSNVKIPKTGSILGHVVIGSNGIFIIQNKTSNVNFIIRNDDWWREKSNKRTKAISNPGKMVKMNAVDLKRFLESHNVNVEYMWITPIVSLPHERYTIEEAPKNYSLMPPEDVSRFITSQKRTMPQDIMLRTIALLAGHSN